MGWSDADALGVGESSQGMDANAVGSGLGGGSSGSNSIIDAIRNTFSAYAPQGIANAWNTASLLGRKNALASPTNVDLNAQREMDKCLNVTLSGLTNRRLLWDGQMRMLWELVNRHKEWMPIQLALV